MTPPECAATVDYLAAFGEPEPVPAVPLPSRELTIATVFIVVLFVAVVIYEWWVVKTQRSHPKRRTISQRIQKFMKGHLKWQILTAVGAAFLWWHLVRGGPW